MAAQPPRPRMPPLSALRAFEVAGRLGGFASAAQELGVTPGAVTAHLKTLENQLGAALFERQARGVRLTELGERVLPDFSAAFAALEAAVHRLEVEAAPGLVRVATTQDLAQLWLSPRLSGLRAQGLQVVPVPVTTLDQARVVADIAVLIDAGGPIAAPLIAVAAPDLAPGLAPNALDPAQCLTLAGVDGDWPVWCRAAGIPSFVPRGPVHASAALAVEEAANGAGVLVISRPYAEAAIRAGRLVALFGVEAETGRGLRLSVLRDSPAARAVIRALEGR